MKKDIFSDSELPVMPSFGSSGAGEYDPSQYTVKYIKADIEDPEQRLLLSEIETRGIRNDGIVLLKRDSYAFMDKFIIVVQYMERNPRAVTR